MVHTKIVPVSEIQVALGRQLESYRLARNITQAELAEGTGISRNTIARLENGRGVSLDTFIRVLNELGLTQNLMGLVPDTTIWPLERVHRKGKSRQRARKSTQDRVNEKSSSWAWGDPDNKND